METIGIIWCVLVLLGGALMISCVSERATLAGAVMALIAWAMWAFIPFHP